MRFYLQINPGHSQKLFPYMVQKKLNVHESNNRKGKVPCNATKDVHQRKRNVVKGIP